MGILSILAQVIVPGGLSIQGGWQGGRYTGLKSTEEIVSSSGLAPELLNTSRYLCQLLP